MDLKIERLDHLGIIGGVIQDLGLIERIDSRLGHHSQEEVSHGECVAAMILNGLGCSDRPLSLTPQFFETQALSHLLGRSLEAKHFNHYKLGRSLEASYAYGCGRLFGELSWEVCQLEGVERSVCHGDTTSVSVTGDYEESSDEHAIVLKHGYSKDHRPDLKQVVHEMVVSSDGGVPLACRSFDGNQSDEGIFRQRMASMCRSLAFGAEAPTLVLDAKGYNKEASEYLKSLRFVMPIPATLRLAQDLIAQALRQPDDWQDYDETQRYQSFDLCHYGIAQRWVVVSSEAAFFKAGKALDQQRRREQKSAEKQLKAFQLKRFSCAEDAKAALEAIEAQWKFHQVKSRQWIDHAQSSKPHTTSTHRWQIKAILQRNDSHFQALQQQKACYIVAASLDETPRNPQTIIRIYKDQNNTVERGFRFLKDPLFFAASLYVKKPQRVEALLMIMTLALLVYTIAQRRLHQHLKATQQTLPNQIRQPKSKPTLRWIFQCLLGIDRVSFLGEQAAELSPQVQGINELRKKILQGFGSTVLKIYQLE